MSHGIPLTPEQAAHAAARIRHLHGINYNRSDVRDTLRRLEMTSDEQAINAVLTHASSSDFELPTVAGLRQQLAEYEQLFELQHTRTREADERWRAEDPETRKAVHPDLGVLLTWLMTDADNARTQLAKAERERDSLARRLGIRFEQIQTLDQMRATLASRLDRLRTAADDLIDALEEGDIDTIGRIERLREAVHGTRGEEDDTRMTLTDKAAEYLDATGSAITGGRSFGDAAGEGSSDPEITADVNGSASTVADPSRSMHNWHYGAPETESAPDIATVNDRGETREPVTTDRYMMATRATHQLGDLSREPANLALITGEDDDHWIGSWVEGYGYFNVHFPKATTRPLTDAEITLYDGHLVEVAGHDNYVIRIPATGGILGVPAQTDTPASAVIPPLGEA